MGHVKAIYRYPVKSMRGETLDEAQLGFLGFVGDRRFAYIQAYIQTEDRTGFPWLMGHQFPGMVRYTPSFIDPSEPHKAPCARCYIPA